MISVVRIISHVSLTLQEKYAVRRIAKYDVLFEILLGIIVSYSMFDLVCVWTVQKTVHDDMRNKWF